jgi:plasmid stabilization system protein ParE
MATLVVTPTARGDLKDLVRTLSLPANTVERLRASLRPLERFPLLGAPLEGRWSEFRFVLGPWRWMLIVYIYDASADRVAIVTIHDARSAAASTSVDAGR